MQYYYEIVAGCFDMRTEFPLSESIREIIWQTKVAADFILQQHYQESVAL
jgi:hypothetical protein